MAFNSKEEAQEFGEKIHKTELNGNPNWQIRVWQNLGWHVCFDLGPLRVYPAKFNNVMTYSTFVSNNNTGGGEIYWSGNNRAATPLLSVKRQLEEMETFINKCIGTFETIVDNL